MIARPDAQEMHPYYLSYVESVETDDVLELLRREGAAWVEEALAWSAAQRRHRYAEGKWSLQELAGHLLDVERIFGGRAVIFARGDTTPQPGFDEDAYVRAGRFEQRRIDGILGEFEALREANLRFFSELDDETARRQGVANGHPMSVRAVAWALAGHLRHHREVVRERYRPGLPS